MIFFTVNSCKKFLKTFVNNKYDQDETKAKETIEYYVI